MQQLFVLLENLLIFLIIIIIGFIIGYKKYVSEEFKNNLSFLLLKVTLPAMLFHALAQPFQPAFLKIGVLTFLLTIVGMAICFLIGYLFMKVFKVKREYEGVWLVAATFSNVGFMGFPVIQAMYGEKGLFLASFNNIAFNLLFYSIGILMISRGKKRGTIKWRDIFLNNVMIAVFLGLFVYFTQIPIPGFIRGLAGMVGDMTTPIAMLIFGLTLSEFPLRDIFTNRTQYAINFVRLLVAPIAFIMLLKVLPLNGNELMISVLAILNAMPIAANTTLLAHEYGGDEEFAAKSTTLSTILCLVTLPIIFLLI